MNRNLALKAIEITALVVQMAGAVVSVAITLNAGRHNKSVILPLMFIFWVLFPFIALLVGSSRSGRWLVVSN